MLLCKVFPIDIALGNGIIGADAESSISNLDWQTIFKIQKADLTYIFQFTTCLTNLSFFISCITTRPPTENSEWPRTDLTFFVKFCSSLQINENQDNKLKTFAQGFMMIHDSNISRHNRQ